MLVPFLFPLSCSGLAQKTIKGLHGSTSTQSPPDIPSTLHSLSTSLEAVEQVGID
jgi:hypothetical protein